MSGKLNRVNVGTKTDRFNILKFDHLEFYCSDALSTAKCLKVGIGMEIVGHSRHETGNHIYASYVLQTGSIRWVVSAPYLSEQAHPKQECPHPNFDDKRVRDFVSKHGNGVAVIALEVDDAIEAFKKSTGEGEEGDDWATPITEPKELKSEDNKGSVVVSDVIISGDTILRFIQYKDGFDGLIMPGYKPFKDEHPLDYGIRRMDHVVGNVHDMKATCDHIKKFLGLHTFAAFSKEDIQTEWTSLNSEVLANNLDTVLLPINEPAKHKKESQITEYLKAYNGAGVQHIALFSNDVLETIGMMRKVSHIGGFEFIPTPPTYYDDENVKKEMDAHLSKEAQELAKEYGLLIDQDDEGVLLQIFTKPLFDRPTLFVEIIQRVCHGEIVDKPGCGGFGKGNFRALFQSIERMQAQREMLLEEKE